MRVLHAAAVLAPPVGVVNQMRWEQDAADRLGLAWDARVYCPAGSIDHPRIAVVASDPPRLGWARANRLAAYASLRAGYYRWLTAQSPSYDALVLRYYPHDPLQVRFIRRSRVPVYLVHHTLETKELRSAGLQGTIRAAFDDVFGPIAIRECAGLIGVTREIVDYEMRRSGRRPGFEHVYPNGVTYAGNVAADARASVPCPELLFVASGFVDWHGLDLLLTAAEKNSSRFLVHLVGDVSPADRSRAIADGRFEIHGRLPNARIAELAARCSLGLSSFALWRKEMAEACTIKVREYLMLGLPVYAGHRDVFPTTFEFYRAGPVEFSKILEYANGLRGVTRHDVSTASRPYIEKDVLLSRLWEALEGARREY